MPAPTGPTDPELRRLIIGLERTKDSSYAELARRLRAPRRQKAGVTVGRIEEVAKAGDRVATVWLLGDGEITKPVTVYAWKASGAARQKVERAGGRIAPIRELLLERVAVRVL